MTWEKFKAMTLKQKLEHIWTYYRWQILVTVLIVFSLSVWIGGILSETDPYMQVEMVNCYGNTPGSEAFRDFLEKEGLSYFEDAVIIGKNIQLDGPDASQNMGAAQMLFCTLAAGEPDLLFWDAETVLPALDGGQLLDLRDVLPEDLLKEYEDSLVYAAYADSGETYPCGIYTERNSWIMEHHYYVNCSVGVSASCKDRALAADFIEYMLSYGA